MCVCVCVCACVRACVRVYVAEFWPWDINSEIDFLLLLHFLAESLAGISKRGSSLDRLSLSPDVHFLEAQYDLLYLSGTDRAEITPDDNSINNRVGRRSYHALLWRLGLPGVAATGHLVQIQQFCQ